MNIQIKKLLITFILLALAAISPNLFVAAQAGIATFSSLAIEFLVPSFALILLVIVISKLLKYTDIFRLAVNGILAGIISTVALEIFRELGFRFGMMPGDLPRLMGVILLNQFSSGPDIWSDLAGWSYHAWNGAAFGLIFSLVLGQSKIWQGFLYGLLIGIGFMISPVVKSLGIGLFGINFKDGYQFALTVTIAHAAFGLALSFLLMKWNKGISNICLRWKNKL
jgi:Ca2+/Na+ antiporter